jgi:predicted amidohydrolase
MTLLSVAQMNSQNDIEDNFIVIERLLQQSKAQAANLMSS